MSQFQRLLVIVDPQLRHSPALQRAAALAQASAAAQVHVAALVVIPALVALLPEDIRERTREGYAAAHRSRLDEQVEPLLRQGLSVSREVIGTDDRRVEILRHVGEWEPDLLIKDVQHESEFKRTFMTPLDWRLLRDCPAPLHLVAPGGHAQPRVVVAAIDPSRGKARDVGLNRRIIDTAQDFANQSGASLHLLHAYDPLRYYMSADAGGPSVSWGEIAGELHDLAQHDFHRLADACRIPAEHRHFLLGPPTMAIADFARDHGVDVLVMGRVQRKGLDKLVGSTAEHVLNQVPCGILAIAPVG